MSQFIEVTVLPTGEVKIETKGFAGEACRNASQFVEAALGTKTHEQWTAEYFQQQSQSESIRESQ